MRYSTTLAVKSTEYAQHYKRSNTTQDSFWWSSTSTPRCAAYSWTARTSSAALLTDWTLSVLWISPSASQGPSSSSS